VARWRGIELTQDDKAVLMAALQAYKQGGNSASKVDDLLNEINPAVPVVAVTRVVSILAPIQERTEVVTNVDENIGQLQQDSGIPVEQEPQGPIE
jgi:hypothetical protein